MRIPLIDFPLQFQLQSDIPSNPPSPLNCSELSYHCSGLSFCHYRNLYFLSSCHKPLHGLYGWSCFFSCFVHVCALGYWALSVKIRVIFGLCLAKWFDVISVVIPRGLITVNIESERISKGQKNQLRTQIKQLARKVSIYVLTNMSWCCGFVTSYKVKWPAQRSELTSI